MQRHLSGNLDFDLLRASSREAAALLSVLAHPNRLLLLCHLMEGEMAVGPLAAAVGMNQSALSQQLARLRAMEIVETRREGRTIFYRLASPRIQRLIATLHDLYCAGPQPRERSTAAEGV